MVPIISLLVVVFVSILITRIGAIALTHTGLTRETARFQARSAFSGAGFTTEESEMVVNHPVRRRIVMMLILIGNAGIVAAMSSLILTFINNVGTGSVTLRIVFLVTGLVALWGLASSRWVDQKLSYLIDRLLKRYTTLNIRDYASLLHLQGEYRLAEMQVKGEDWLTGQTLRETRLRDEGINVLGIKRADGTYLGNPNGDTLVQENDNLVIYGRTETLQELDRRKEGYGGDQQHRKAVSTQQQVVDDETEQDPATSDPS